MARNIGAHRRQQQDGVAAQHGDGKDEQVHRTLRPLAANLSRRARPRVVNTRLAATARAQGVRTHSAHAKLVTASANVLGSVRLM